VVDSLGAPLVILACVVAPVLAVIGILYLCDVPVLQRLSDRMTTFRHRAHVLRLLAAGFDGRQPINQTLSRLAAGGAPYPSAVVRRRLDRAARLAAAGQPWQDALQQSALISATDAAVLRSAQAAGNLPWACRLLADRKVRIASFRRSILQQAAFVAVTFFLGFLVLIYAVAMITPLADLVQSLA
jgi:type II secretory pathway component PulF